MNVGYKLLLENSIAPESCSHVVHNLKTETTLINTRYFGRFYVTDVNVSGFEKISRSEQPPA